MMEVSIIEIIENMSERIKMDFIGNALKNMKLTADRFGRAEVSAPWQKASQQTPIAYYFLRGQGEITLDSQPAHCIEAGDLVLVPRGETHVLRGEAAGDSLFLYATIQADIGSGCPFIAALPSLLILNAEERTTCPSLNASLQSLVWESVTGGTASEFLLARLWEVVFLSAFRSYLSQTSDHTTGWLAAIRDPQMARALGAIQQRLQEDWTVERLANEASMSRATFIRQFARLMGEPPMKFLYLLRMRVAAKLLQQGGSLAAVAAQVGYGSEAAFSNAFRRRYGCAPGAYRTANAR